MNRKLLSGDEAIARGAWEAGCHVAAAYPGTPSTEILETLAGFSDVYCEWSTNEKVALEVALGASISGARALAAMKHVGLNVAADPLFSAAHIGARGGLVIVTADDPGLHSSQNEQDNRFYALAAKIPMFCPADSQEAKDFTRLAFEVSEEYDVPVLIRITTRVAHSSSIVTIGERAERPVKGYEKQVSKTVLLPVHARIRHVDLEHRLDRLRAYSERTSANRVEQGERRIGIICDGVAYHYCREVFPEVSYLKLGMVYPFPASLVRKFAAGVDQVIVVEEVDPFLELHVRSLGIEATGKDKLPRWGELNPRVVRLALGRPSTRRQEPREGSGEISTSAQAVNSRQPNDGNGLLGTVAGTRQLSPDKAIEPEPDLPSRPPALCPGCPHTGLFYALQKQRVIIGGDIGCYTLGALPPHNSMDTCIDMGASITFAHGCDKALGRNDPRRRVAVIGDSTFFHSGITGLLNVVYNKSDVVVVIADNRTTGMTGHQDHPGTGRTLSGEETVAVDIAALARACGIERVVAVDPYRVKETRRLIRELLKQPGPAVVISRRPCALLVRLREKPRKVNTEKCTGCKTCLGLGCPALTMVGEKTMVLEDLCAGCGMCADVCPQGAIE